VLYQARFRLCRHVDGVIAVVAIKIHENCLESDLVFEFQMLEYLC
jgi:hypothetical protein